ncbi:MAG: hypothetical protein EHM33_30190 [Chloroflexi bacterium]|nr:MAG: hypothetical protein EHM33_30190 [Chloroflexota bacterium]
MITDEMVQTAIDAWINSPPGATESMRAALEAVAPMLIAQGMMEARLTAPILSKYHGRNGFEQERFIDDYNKWQDHHIARAQELDPQ